VRRLTPGPDATTAVAALPERDLYAYASRVDRACAVTLTVVRNGRAEPPLRIEGDLTELAFAPDGARLAYVVRGGARCDRATLHVRTLATGAERVWDDGYGTTAHVVGGTFVQHLSWSPDGTRLAYDDGVCCALSDEGYRVLDVAAPGQTFTAPPRHGGAQPDGYGTCVTYGVTYRGRTGALAGIHACMGPDDETPPAGRLVVLDEATGAVTAELATLPVLASGDRYTVVAFDPSGDTALLRGGPEDRPGTVWRWTRAGVVRVADGVVRLAW
jgi:dipeptidyl aminopeptidase/acylaminoacyl peptidase